MLTFIASIYCEIMFSYSNARTVIAITVIMLLLQFQLGPPGLSIPLHSHSARLIGNRDSRNVGNAAKRGRGGLLVHLITRALVYPPGCGGTMGGRMPLSFELATGCSKKAFRP